MRFAGQLRTYLNPKVIAKAGVAIPGEVVEVITVTEEGVASAEAAFARIAAKLESGSLAPVLSGSIELMDVLRNLLIGL